MRGLGSAHNSSAREIQSTLSINKIKPQEPMIIREEMSALKKLDSTALVSPLRKPNYVISEVSAERQGRNDPSVDASSNEFRLVGIKKERSRINDYINLSTLSISNKLDDPSTINQSKTGIENLEGEDSLHEVNRFELGRRAIAKSLSNKSIIVIKSQTSESDFKVEIPNITSV